MGFNHTPEEGSSGGRELLPAGKYLVTVNPPFNDEPAVHLAKSGSGDYVVSLVLITPDDDFDDEYGGHSIFVHDGIEGPYARYRGKVPDLVRAIYDMQNAEGQKELEIFNDLSQGDEDEKTALYLPEDENGEKDSSIWVKLTELIIGQQIYVTVGIKERKDKTGNEQVIYSYEPITAE